MHDINYQLTINEHSCIKLKVSEDNKVLPSIYYIPKLRAKVRCIIKSMISLLKPLTKSITSVFKVIKEIVLNPSNKCRYFSDMNASETVLYSKAFIIRMKNLIKLGKVEFIIAFNFCTLYTNIDYSKPLKVLNNLIDFCFGGGSHKYISVNKFSAKWISKPDSYSVVFDKRSFKKATSSF